MIFTVHWAIVNKTNEEQRGRYNIYCNLLLLGRGDSAALDITVTSTVLHLC